MFSFLYFLFIILLFFITSYWLNLLYLGPIHPVDLKEGHHQTVLKPNALTALTIYDRIYAYGFRIIDNFLTLFFRNKKTHHRRLFIKEE
jgi:hypothetical protein